MKYTKGEWEAGYNPGVTGPTTPAITPVCGGKDWPYRTVNIGTETIAICPAQDIDRTHKPSISEAEANAQLISAAPELYEALKGMVKWFGKYPAFIPNPDMDYQSDIDKSIKALAKVDGK